VSRLVFKAVGIGAVVGLLLITGYLVLQYGAGDQQPVEFQGQNLSIEVGELAGRDGNIAAILNQDGRAAVAVPGDSLDLSDYKVVELNFGVMPKDASIMLIWQPLGQSMTHVDVPWHGEQNLVVSMLAEKQWKGTPGILALMVNGSPGSRFELESVVLKPAQLWNHFGEVFSQWYGDNYWEHHSVNINTGVRSGYAKLLPLPAIMVLLVLSLLTYLLLLRKRQEFSVDWRIIGAIVFIHWLALDLIWQYQLGMRSLQTFDKLAGLAQEQKIAVTDDADYKSMAEAISTLDIKPEEKIILVGKDQFRGMRIAYFIYPENVYFRRNSARLSIVDKVLPGDLVITVGEPASRFNPRNSSLTLPEGDRLQVSPLADFDEQPLVRSGTVQVFRVR